MATSALAAAWPRMFIAWNQPGRPWPMRASIQKEIVMSGRHIPSRAPVAAQKSRASQPAENFGASNRTSFWIR
jgi:hypothetical protein